MRKKKFQLSKIYLAVIMLLTYLPLAMVVIFSFNDSKLTVSWKGFTWRWYEELWPIRRLKKRCSTVLFLA